MSSCWIPGEHNQYCQRHCDSDSVLKAKRCYPGTKQQLFRIWMKHSGYEQVILHPPDWKHIGYLTSTGEDIQTFNYWDKLGLVVTPLLSCWHICTPCHFVIDLFIQCVLLSTINVHLVTLWLVIYTVVIFWSSNFRNITQDYEVAGFGFGHLPNKP